ncbi:uncharacterized protein G2W53_009137 [Senna tora]|uniref:Uncharacterized protein n=1 Tax=Senna tora TaxID=362788 RepID=A0A834WX95_9FABA|nr:uncharacterized protein G2W53_009137 [Senna tora]
MGWFGLVSNNSESPRQASCEFEVAIRLFLIHRIRIRRPPLSD